MNELEEAFKGYVFYPEDHHYELDGKRVGTSVTTLIHEYSNIFDKEGLSKRQSEKLNIPQSEILEKWRLDNLYSTAKGTLVHLYAQALWNDEEVELNYDQYKELDIESLKKSVENSCIQAKKFYLDHKDTLKIFRDEFIVGSMEYDIAGSIDNLLINKDSDTLVLIDYKTNKEIKFNSFNNKKMLYPIDNIEDCNYIHYSLQLNIYKYLIENYTSIKVKNVFLVYFNELEKDYHKFKVLNLKNEAIKLLETRRK
ncbi:MAG: PD-(D/E)XK nuclease family protein [Bacilli bacterium]